MGRIRALKQIAAATIVTILTPLPAFAQPNRAGPVDAGQVLTAIERGAAFLKREQGPRGNWPEILTNNPGGITALCTLALLNAGVEVDDPVMRKALTYLRGQDLERTYTVALRAMVLCAAEPKKDLVLISRDVRWLESTQITAGRFKGAWSYPGAAGDNSNSQFAILALSDAQRAGVAVKRETWEMARDYWTRTQNADGSWGYTPGEPGDGSMTCAGIGGLAISTAALESGDAAVEDGQVQCCRPHSADDNLERAINWLAQRFSVSRNPRPANRGQPVIYYYLYGLERAGRLTARRFIGDHDWYREGAEFLVHQQDPLSHYWTHNWYAESEPHISTSLALLFLSKGRRPIVMAKLKSGQGDGDWNHHRRDAAHLTAYTEERWKVGLTWQIMDPAAASVEDLLQAPVLYVSGRNLPQLTEHAKKLRDYIDRGGFLFAEACCGESGAFDEGFRKLMTAVFPEPEYQLQRIVPGHPIWRMEEIVRPDSPYLGQLWGVEYGCRTSVIYCERDLSCYWELAQPGQWNRYPQQVVEHITDALAVGVNVLTYATNREPKGKEQAFNTLAAGDSALTEGPRGVVEIVKLRHGGGCNDAPGALVNLLRAASQGELQLRVRAAPELINISDENLFRYHLAFIHGRQDFRLTPAERTRLREYLERGGTLLADAICASQPFTTAIRRELAESLPGRTITRIPADDPLFTTGFGGFDVRQVTLREPQPAGGNQPVAARTRQIEPQLEGIQIDGRWAVIFSPYDISCALESHEAVGCRGYIREDAARIGLNVLLYSLNQ
jgi:hypothetical protein